MSRLFKQIQQAQAKEPVFIPHLESSFKRERRFNLFPCFCIIALFVGIVTAYFYTDREPQTAIALKEVDATLPIQENSEMLAEDIQPPLQEAIDLETPIQGSDFENALAEKHVALDFDEPIPVEELVFRPLQWDIASLKDWVQEHWGYVFPKIQEFRDSLHRFAYFDVTQPIPEREISALEKERLELIRRFLKKFKIDAVRIDGSYSRVMANGQAFYVNTVVSQRPKLKLTRITSQEMIFKDEYNQEYRKEISQND